MPKVLITVEEFMDRYSVSHENFDFLVRTGELTPFKWGLQTFLDFERADLMVCNTIMMAEMAAGLHHPKKPKRTT
jgi:hypothetical protein